MQKWLFPHPITRISWPLKPFQLHRFTCAIIILCGIGNKPVAVSRSLTLINRDSAWLGAVILVWVYKWHLMHFSSAVYLQTSFQRMFSIEHTAYESSSGFILGNHSSLKKMVMVCWINSQLMFVLREILSKFLREHYISYRWIRKHVQRLTRTTQSHKRSSGWEYV